MKSDSTNVAGRERPGKDLEVGRRISAALRLYDSKNAAAKIAGVSPDQLTRYERGASTPPFDVVIRLAAGVGVSLQWLATGEGEMQPHKGDTAQAGSSEPVPLEAKPTEIDPRLLAICTQAADNALTELRVHADREQHAQLVAQLYNQYLKATPEEIKRDADIERKRLINKRAMEDKKSNKNLLAS
ncbi:helix-turn-helix domain-containing protein [Niveispirillum sp. SYP-B3756]|uniref:helix-turn-helix domain-containing protein n=1 Tax=Niveispirillum sp. SYP-B3756 TaxID=2662178 RepID=UPI001290FD76|nr:helix-turn-helix transcriptional regulator [Niveispirillum sp. SYP-B3756]MQP64740.1 helix-turn-helix domain-containing protein [Niveispirillum sp. SYP-B3756]